MVKDAITFDIKGIKCDNRACGWSDMTVAFDPEAFLDKPCPNCGANLFTRADYKTMKRMFRIARVINFIFRPFIRRAKNKEMHRLDVSMNGSGKIQTREII